MVAYNTMLQIIKTKQIYELTHIIMHIHIKEKNV